MNMCGKSILVVGAEGPLGQAVAVLLSQLGASVVIAAAQQKALTETMGLLVGEGHHAVAYPAGQADEIPAWLRSLAGEIGVLDGVCFAEEVESPKRRVTSEYVPSIAFREVMQQSIYPAFALAKGLRHKKVRAESSGLVFLLSLEGLEGSQEQASFAASQGAIHSMTKALSLELARENIRVNGLAVGPMSTGASAKGLGLLGQGSPQDVAQAAAFLLANTGRWITGTTMVVDGGFTLASKGRT